MKLPRGQVGLLRLVVHAEFGQAKTEIVERVGEAAYRAATAQGFDVQAQVRKALP